MPVDIVNSVCISLNTRISNISLDLRLAERTDRVFGYPNQDTLMVENVLALQKGNLIRPGKDF